MASNLVKLAGVVATGAAAAWLHSRTTMPQVEARTRRRLLPYPDSAPKM